MAVKKQPQQFVRDYWPAYKSRSLFLVVSMQFISTLVVGCALLITGMVDPLDSRFWISIIAIITASVSLNVIVFTIITEPLRTLSYAITHASGETTRTTPPNPNVKRYEKNGLRPLLLTIYEAASSIARDAKPASSDEANDTDAASTTKLLLRGLDATTTGIVLIDKDGEIIYANRAVPLRDTTDNSRKLGLLFDEAFDLTAWINQCKEGAFRAEKTWKRVANKLPGEENRRLYDIAAFYEKDSDVEVVITLFDRTNDYQPEDDDLDFIAFAAHELRGPVTVIRGYLDALSDELANRLANDEQALFNRLIISANRLSGYINNILNAAKFDRRHLKMHLKEETVANVYDTIRDDMVMRAGAQNRILDVAIPGDLPIIAADKSSLSEVLSNLIDNAIKYSNEGGVVTVRAQAVGDKVEVSVADTGIGMPSNVVSNLFHKFYRSHRSRETVAGTGIGLYICKAIVESHGGTISVRSVEGRGSTFSFSIPTYASVAEKLKDNHNSNESLIETNQDGWIKNHGTFRG